MNLSTSRKKNLVLLAIRGKFDARFGTRNPSRSIESLRFFLAKKYEKSGSLNWLKNKKSKSQRVRDRYLKPFIFHDR